MVPSASSTSTAICKSLFYWSLSTLPSFQRNPPTPSSHILFRSDTWRPRVFGGAPTAQAAINHGTYFYHAHAEGLLANDSNIHAGIRTTLSGLSDYDNDGYCGFEIVEAREIDSIGTAGIIKKIRERVGKKPVYLSIDIDTLDPACMSSPLLSVQTIPFMLPSTHITSHHITSHSFIPPILTTKQTPPQPAPPKPAAGRPANSAPSSAVWTA